MPERKKGKEVALRFEQMRAVFAILLMKDRLNESLPLTILASRTTRTITERTAASGPAHRRSRLLRSGEDQNFIVLNLF